MRDSQPAPDYIKLLPLRKSPLKSVQSMEVFLTDLFPAADSSIGSVIS